MKALNTTKLTQYIIIALLGLIIGLMYWGCSKDASPLPSKTHPESWMDKNSADFHGNIVAESGSESCKSCHGANFEGGEADVSCYSCHGSFPHPDEWMAVSSDMFHGQFVQDNDWDTKGCQNCHGDDYLGGTSGVSCYTCHNKFPHPEGWVSSSSDNFHGAYLKDNSWNTSSCQGCHGEDFQGGSSQVSCYTCHSSFPHADDWMSVSSEGFHGQYLSDNNYDLSGCQKCHGEDFQGGDVEVSCYTCHSSFPHPADWLSVNSEGFHGNNIRQNGWSLESCKSCHGEDYRGGTSGTSCYTCHTAEAGPEACNVCHGNPDHAYPPEDLSGNTATTALGVGAHEIHMESFSCDLCHVVPTSFDDPTHIDAPPAEVKSDWTWNRDTATCATSCHGDAYVWNNFDD